MGAKCLDCASARNHPRGLILGHAGEQLAIQEFIAEPAPVEEVEQSSAKIIEHGKSFLSGGFNLDPDYLGAACPAPVLQGISDEPLPVVTADDCLCWMKAG